MYVHVSAHIIISVWDMLSIVLSQQNKDQGLLLSVRCDHLTSPPTQPNKCVCVCVLVQASNSESEFHNLIMSSPQAPGITVTEQKTWEMRGVWEFDMNRREEKRAIEWGCGPLFLESSDRDRLRWIYSVLLIYKTLFLPLALLISWWLFVSASCFPVTVPVTFSTH